MQVYLHIYIHIYVQIAHNFDTFYALRLKFGMMFTQTKTLDVMVELALGGQGSECITGHIGHMQNGNGIISLVPLLALESYKSGIMITDEIVYTETRVRKLDHASGGTLGGAKGNSHLGKGHKAGASVYFGHMSSLCLLSPHYFLPSFESIGRGVWEK